MFKKDENRLIELVGSIPSMCLHVSVVFRCVDLLVLHRTASTMHLQILCKHDAKSSCNDFSDMQVHMQGTCMVFAWYLHGLVFAHAY